MFNKVSGQSPRFPLEITNRIVEQLVLHNDIESLRTISRLGDEVLQQSLDTHILTVVINCNDNDDCNYRTQISWQERIPKHGQTLSRNKLYLSHTLYSRENRKNLGKYSDRDNYLFCKALAWYSAGCTCHDVVNLDSRRRRYWMRVSYDDYVSIITHRMVIFEFYNVRETCWRVDKNEALEIIRNILTYNPFRRKAEKMEGYRWWHLQVFKPLPADRNFCYQSLMDCRAKYHIPSADYVILETDKENQISSPLKLRRFFLAYSEKTRLNDPKCASQLVVACPTGVFTDTQVSQHPGFDDNQNIIKRLGCPGLDATDKISSVDVIFYMNTESLRSQFDPIKADHKKKKKLGDHYEDYKIKNLNNKIQGILRLKKREFYFRKFTTLRDLCFERRKQLIDLFAEHVHKTLIENSTEQDQATFDFGYDSNVPFVCFGRFQVSNNILLQSTGVLDYGGRYDNFYIYGMSG